MIDEADGETCGDVVSGEQRSSATVSSPLLKKYGSPPRSLPSRGMIASFEQARMPSSIRM
ncbi:hypothetical protein [Rhodopseudomonas palustris]|uniref:hypothetical protein n=1 Tax=Rhodopseudomonas palustris TaxID=1076 RepID=UPI0005A2BC3B|nr:hypothetical protein [Rhodopseudomonas palustris]